MKKIFIIFIGFLFFSFNNEVISESSELETIIKTVASPLSDDDEFYYIIDNKTGIQPRTWAKTQNYKIKNGHRTYLDTYTTKRKSTISVKITAGPVVVNLKNEYSASGTFKKYRQSCAITVTYKRYRKVDNKYVDTKTATANTSYVDYVRI